MWLAVAFACSRPSLAPVPPPPASPDHPALGAPVIVGDERLWGPSWIADLEVLPDGRLAASGLDEVVVFGPTRADPTLRTALAGTRELAPIDGGLLVAARDGVWKWTPNAPPELVVPHPVGVFEVAWSESHIAFVDARTGAYVDGQQVGRGVLAVHPAPGGFVFASESTASRWSADGLVPLAQGDVGDAVVLSDGTWVTGTAHAHEVAIHEVSGAVTTIAGERTDDDAITRLAPDGGAFFAATFDTLHRFERRDGVWTNVWSAPAMAGIRSVAKRDDEILVASRDGAVRRLTSAGVEIPEGDGPRSEFTVRVSTDGGRIAVIDDADITVWGADGTFAERVPHGASASSLVQVAPDLSYVAVNRTGVEVFAWGATEPVMRLKGHRVAWSPTSAALLVEDPERASVVRTATGEVVATHELGPLSWAPTGELVTVGTDVRWIDAVSGSEVRRVTLPPESDRVRRMRDGRASVSGLWPQTYGTVVELSDVDVRRLYDATTGAFLWEGSGPAAPSPDGRWLAAVDGGALVLRDARTGDVVARGSDPAVTRIDGIDWGGDRIVTHGEGRIAIWTVSER